MGARPAWFGLWESLHCERSLSGHWEPDLIGTPKVSAKLTRNIAVLLTCNFRLSPLLAPERWTSTKGSLAPSGSIAINSW